MVRLRDIAKQAGTSVSTVSIVLSERPSPVRISESTRQAVFEAARQLGYTPNLAARRLRTNGANRRTLIIAIAYPLDSRLSLISRVVEGVQRQLTRVRDELTNAEIAVQLIVETFEVGKLHELRGLAEPLWFNGILITNTSPDDDVYLDALTPSVPVVLLMRRSPHSTVDTDNLAVGRLATEHLIGLGHRRIGLIYPRTGSQAQRCRIEGYRAALRHIGCATDLEVVAPVADWPAGGYGAANLLLDRPADDRPTAIFATNDLLAIGAIRAIRDRGLHVPEDMSVVGCDDFEFAAYQDPPLTTVRIPIEDMAAQATTILLDLMYQRVAAPVQVTVPSSLVVRKSTSRPVEIG
jgi:LacI family transcriptional regulator